MRIVTRADFDGIVCSVILNEVFDTKTPVLWIEPNQIQNGTVDIYHYDIIANLPYHKNCYLWFDHHYTNKIDIPFNGSFKIAPSAAGVVYEYFKDKLKKDFQELIKETDKIDSAQLSKDEVNFPEQNPYVLISMTISNNIISDEPYWNHLVSLLRKLDINTIINDPEVKKKCNDIMEENKKYKVLLEKNTTCIGTVAITDFRSLDLIPNGNRFLTYSLFPESTVSIKIRHDKEDRDKIILSAGRNIFNKKSDVNLGKMLSKYGGGGHEGAAACSFHKRNTDNYLSEIIHTLLTNKEESIKK